MTSFSAVPKPPRVGRFANELADIYTTAAGTGDGFVGTGTLSLAHSNIPCRFQTMSSNEQQKYGSLVEETLYEVYLPLVSMSGADILVVGAGSAWQFQIAGARYEAIGAGVKQGDGMQRIALRRVGTV